MIRLDNDMVYLAGVVAGDGHLVKGIKWKGKDNSKDYGIFIHSGNKKYLSLLLKLIKEKIKTKSKVSLGKRSYYIGIRNKEFYITLNNKLEIPSGKKSDRIFIPPMIKKDKRIIYFIAGLFDTDGGFRRGSIGFCSAS